MEKKTTIKVPDAYLPLLEDIRLLKSDGDNPNYMTVLQLEETWKSLKEFGWAYPIVTDLNGVFSNGEQRVSTCLSHDEIYAPVLRLSLTDAKRRLFRQISNKLHGRHNRDLDEADYSRIIEQGEKEYLKALLDSVGERLPQDFLGREFSVTIPATYEIIVECKDEAYQKQTFEKLKTEGYKLRILTL